MYKPTGQTDAITIDMQMDDTLCTPETVAREVLARRHEINECIRNGISTDAYDELNVHKCQALDSFHQDTPEHGDLLLFVSQQVNEGKMDLQHPVAFRLHPVTQDRVYARASDFTGLEPVERDTYEHLTVVKQDIWQSMSPDKRQQCMDKGGVVLTTYPNNETLRAAGFRKASVVDTVDDNGTPDNDIPPESGPVAFLKALQVHWHQ